MMWIGNSKLLLVSLGFALAAASFYVPMPMLTGALKTSDDYTRCDACHVHEQEEFTKSVVHKTLTCINCHNISDFASDLYSHNATTVECTYCHVDQNESNFYNDAHKNFPNATNATMCITCHSRAEVEIKEHRYNSMNIAVSEFKGRWELTHTYS